MLRAAGVVCYAIGVGSGIKQEQLRLLASGDTNSGDRVYKVTDFAALDSIVSDLQTEVLQYALEGDTLLNTTTFGMEFSQTGFSLSFGGRYNGSRLVGLSTCVGIAIFMRWFLLCVVCPRV